MQIIFPAFTSRMQLLALYVFKRVRVTNVTSVQDVISISGQQGLSRVLLDPGDAGLPRSNKQICRF